jgi:hypothetical protein
MDLRIPKPIQPTLLHYLALMDQQLPDLLRAFYVEGSIALGGFNEHFSDIDFIATLHHQMLPPEIDALRNIHQIVTKNYPRWKLEGRYLPAHIFDQGDQRDEPNPHYHDGALHLNGHFELNSVEGWILKNHGIALVGPAPQELPFTIEWAALIMAIRQNLNSYWVQWTNRPTRLLMMLSDWGIQWAVLGVLRQFYSFRENTITTKVRAGEYALTCLPAHWHPLIQEALRIRAGQARSAYSYRPTRTIEAISFLKFIIQTCNANFI